jgi:hypothetical protein
MKRNSMKDKSRTRQGEKNPAPEIVDDFLAPVPARKSFQDYPGFSMKGIPSVSLVSSVAVRLKKEEQDWAAAVNEALELLNAASELVYILEEEKKAPEPLDPPDYAKFTFVKGVKRITGQTRKDRAVEVFQDLLYRIIEEENWEVACAEGRTDYANNEDHAENRKALFASLTEYETNGFNGKQIRCFQGALKETKKPKGQGGPPLWVFFSD